MLGRAQGEGGREIVRGASGGLLAGGLPCGSGRVGGRGRLVLPVAAGRSSTRRSGDGVKPWPAQRRRLPTPRPLVSLLLAPRRGARPCTRHRRHSPRPPAFDGLHPTPPLSGKRGRPRCGSPCPAALVNQTPPDWKTRKSLHSEWITL